MDTKQLKQKILDLAIRGKLVPQDPNDEPASVLLERIRKEKEQLIASGKLKKTKSKTTDTPHYENVPFEIPASWEWVRLEELCSIKGGKRIPKGKSFSSHPTKHIYIRVTDMKKNTILDNDLQYIDEEVFTKICNYTIKKEDLYLTIAGTIGAVGEVPDLFDGMNLTENAAKLTHIQCDKKYLMYALLSTSAQDHFKSKFHQVAQPKLSIETASSTPIALPPLAEQKRIVEEIERWFALIDEIEANKQDLQEYIKQAKSKVLDLAIHGKLVPQDPNDEPAIDLLKRINPNFTPCHISHYENLPSGWAICRLSDIAKISAGGTPSRKISSYWEGGTIPWLKIADMTASGKYVRTASEYITEEGMKNSSAKLMNKGTLLYTIFASIGEVGILDFDATCNQAIANIDLYMPEMTDYIYYYLKNLQTYMYSISKGCTQQNINQGILKNATSPLPPLAEQKRIVERIETIFAQLDTITAEL